MRHYTHVRIKVRKIQHGVLDYTNFFIISDVLPPSSYQQSLILPIHRIIVRVQFVVGFIPGEIWLPRRIEIKL